MTLVCLQSLEILAVALEDHIGGKFEGVGCVSVPEDWRECCLPVVTDAETGCDRVGLEDVVTVDVGSVVWLVGGCGDPFPEGEMSSDVVEYVVLSWDVDDPHQRTVGVLWRHG